MCFAYKLFDELLHIHKGVAVPYNESNYECDLHYDLNSN